MTTSSLTTLHRAANLQILHIKSNPSTSYERTNLKSESPAIPSRSLFESLSNPTSSPTSLPTISECAVHLELLQVFNSLKLRVLACNELDDTFGIKPDKRTVYRRRWSNVQRRHVIVPHKLRDLGFARRRLEKWPHYLGLAVTRFKVWVKMVEDGVLESCDGELMILPPLDVLMVWHAFLLNPSDFDAYCDKDKLDLVRKMHFPWKLIHASIDPHEWKYHLPEHHTAKLQSTNLEPDLLETLIQTAKSNTEVSSLLSRFSCTKRGILETFNIIRKYNKDKPPLPRPQSFLENIHSSFLQSQTQENKSLIDQIQRQVSFVEKMDAQLWIRSPAVKGTLGRGIERYEKFLQLLKLYPKKSLVPTLDVDLVWHTHQCSAGRYREAMLERVGRFVNHDDRVGKGVVRNGMQYTAEVFGLRFGQKYEVCLCWDCEAIVDAVEGMQADENEGDVHEFVKNVAEKVLFHREVEVARRMGKMVPVRRLSF
ncbi:hypothetical protein P170DRAFT_439690 [Aspergillus steynii IBT 23096]|uniref:Uncharacterized protein n=1 Tax=Aspergillus steynii IBT 23096 TaxID=1392250 RepID=A0A2I2FZJ9_9EURO|nr:uncharacterized protein P170DRAFT_439690 [Aspergillus steynii IBT 23096]PLB45996.1 hypothetical protein P170DRAFT_439690 [Aspergillus steynii IBT 23096]